MLIAGLAAIGIAAAPAPSDVLTLGRELRIRVTAGRELAVEVKPRPEEDVRALARRMEPLPVRTDRLAAHLADPKSRTEDGFYRIPFPLLGAEARVLALRTLFPQDRAEAGDWLHVARTSPLPVYDEGLWQVALWFTGDGSHFDELLRVNGLSSPELRPGQVVRIPASLLDDALKPRPTSDDGSLTYQSDASGRFAGYRLKPGEALYSAVVLRYTGRTAPEDVESLARTIAARSGIRDLKDIPAGWLIKIPLDALDPEFLPESDARKKDIESAKAAMERELAARPPKEAQRGLQKVVVIIDPGHGGMDPGTMSHALREHDYVFDVAKRLRRELETHTGAKVVFTLDDPRDPSAPSPGDDLPWNKRRAVLTTPPFVAAEHGETAIAVNLRWYLANSVYRRLVKGGTDPDRIVFVSLHADARHPSLRGAMVYVPGARFRTGTMGHTSSSYMRFKEVRELPRVSYSSRDRLRSEAVSRKLAGAILKAMRKDALPIQPYQPIRERVIRGGDVWLPAVLRGNAVPTKVLVEMLNLNNDQDAAMLARAKDRERLAKSLAAALALHFAPAPKRRS